MIILSSAFSLLYFPAKGGTTPPFSVPELLLPLSVSLICHPLPDPQSQHLITIPLSTHQGDFLLGGPCWYINYPHIFNRNLLPGHNETLTLDIINASLDISKLPNSSSLGSSIGKSVEVLLFLTISIFSFTTFSQPYILCSVLCKDSGLLSLTPDIISNIIPTHQSLLCPPKENDLLED